MRKYIYISYTCIVFATYYTYKVHTLTNLIILYVYTIYTYTMYYTACSNCMLGTYISQSCSQFADTVCSTCSSCSLLEYQTTPCTGTQGIYMCVVCNMHMCMSNIVIYATLYTTHYALLIYTTRTHPIYYIYRHCLRVVPAVLYQGRGRQTGVHTRDG